MTKSEKITSMISEKFFEGVNYSVSMGNKSFR